MEIIPQPLTAEAFAPFGEVIDVPNEAGRTYYEEALGNLRSNARPSLSMTFRAETTGRPVKAEMLERHGFSSQTFVPVDVDRWLIVVAPHARQGGPDIAQVRAFIANGRQGVTYKPGVWHHPIIALERETDFACLVWEDGSSLDCEVADLPEPAQVSL